MDNKERMEDKIQAEQENISTENITGQEGSAEEKTEKEEQEEKKLTKKEKMKKQIKELEQQIGELKDKNLRLFAEFDNFRKRTARERIEFTKTAGQDIVADLLPVLDDLQRAKQSIAEAKDLSSVQEGFNLIHTKFRNTLEQKGLKEMEAMGKEFNSEIHEAITEIPAPSEDMKGKVVDVVQSGFYLNDKIIRYAKVVVGK